eukprot:403372292
MKLLSRTNLIIKSKVFQQIQNKLPINRHFSNSNKQSDLKESNGGDSGIEFPYKFLNNDKFLHRRETTVKEMVLAMEKEVQEKFNSIETLKHKYVELLKAAAENDSIQLGKLCEKNLYREFSSSMEDVMQEIERIEVINDTKDNIDNMNVKLIDFDVDIGVDIDRETNRVNGVNKIWVPKIVSGGLPNNKRNMKLLSRTNLIIKSKVFQQIQNKLPINRHFSNSNKQSDLKESNGGDSGIEFPYKFLNNDKFLHRRETTVKEMVLAMEKEVQEKFNSIETLKHKYVELLKAAAENDSIQLGKLCEKNLYREFSSSMEDVMQEIERIEVINDTKDNIDNMNVKLIDFDVDIGVDIDRETNRVNGVNKIWVPKIVSGGLPNVNLYLQKGMMPSFSTKVNFEFLLRIETAIKLNMINKQGESLISSDQILDKEIHYMKVATVAKEINFNLKFLKEIFSNKEMDFSFKDSLITDFDNCLNGNPHNY